MKNKIIGILIMTLMITTGASQVIACTGFTYSDDENVFACHNEDWHDYNFNLRFFPATEGKFGRMFFEIAMPLENGYIMYPFAGMNDQGLFFDQYSTPDLLPINSRDKPHYYNEQMYYPQFLSEYCLAVCSTVDETLDIVDDYNLETLFDFQVLISDSSGNSAILEGDDIIFKEGDFQVVSNFLQSHPELGGIGTTAFERYYKVVGMLENMTEPSIEYFRDICNATHQFYAYGWTVYSSVCDLSNQIIYLYHCYDYEKPVVIDLNEEFKKGEHYIYIGSLFEPEGNQPPEKPATPTGIEEPGASGENYQLKCRKISDPDGNYISYCFNYGDGTYSHWIPSHAGMSTIVSTTHNWTEEGTYEIKVKARDEYGAESEWSDPLSITMSKNKITTFYEIVLWRLIERYPLLKHFL